MCLGVSKCSLGRKVEVSLQDPRLTEDGVSQPLTRVEVTVPTQVSTGPASDSGGPHDTGGMTGAPHPQRPETPQKWGERQDLPHAWDMGLEQTQGSRLTLALPPLPSTSSCPQPWAGRRARSTVQVHTAASLLRR